MDEFKVGDKVRAINAERGADLFGVVREVSNGWLRIAGLMDFLKSPDWSVSLVGHAQPELPTEEGIYFPHKTFQPNRRIVKLQNGEWCNSDGTLLNDDEHEWLWLALKRGDLTKFEPVAETARKVLDAVIDSATKSSSYEFNGRAVYETTAVALDEIGKEFGVSDV